MSRNIDITGQKFGRLLALECDERRAKDNKQYWRCKCDCGKETVVLKANLTRGLTRSCGCLRSEHFSSVGKKPTRHRKRIHVNEFSDAEKRLYSIWKGMKERCSNPNNKDAKYYYFKGVTVCEDWKYDFLLFKKWALSNGYSDGLTIDRIDNTKGYNPENCRWVTMRVQNNNQGKNRYITIDSETLTIADWSRRMGFPRSLISGRLHSGWDEERAVKTPLLSTSKKSDERM